MQRSDASCTVDKPRLSLDVSGNEAKRLFPPNISSSILLAEHQSKNNDNKFGGAYSVLFAACVTGSVSACFFPPSSLFL